MKKLITKFLLAVCVLCLATDVMGVTVSWEAPSSVKVGQTFYAYAYVNGVKRSSGYIGVDTSRSTGSVSTTNYDGQWKATKAGTVTFFVQYDVGAQRYTDYKSVTIVADTPPTPPAPKLGSVTISVSSTSVGPGESVTCSLSAYSTTGTSITGGTKSWSISSVTNDTISVSGVVTVDPALVPRIISITGKCTYDGVTKSDTKTVEVVPLVVPTPVITPEDGTIIGESQSVLLSCEDEDAQIYYTTDGSEPTVESALYETRFRVSGKATVKAVAVHEGRLDSEVAVAHYALGQCPDPVIVSAGGEAFLQKGNQVSINWECADGVLRYTTDGSDVAETSPEYAGALTIGDTTTIKAKAFGETYFDSKQVELTVTREWEPVATPLIAAAESFSGRKTMVSISCATEGATIRYTVDGSEPNSHSMRYAGAFEVRESTVVKAFAMLADYANSEVSTKTITKVWGIGDSVGLPDHAFTTDGDAGWVNDGDAAMRSGKITHKQTSVLRSTFVGKGRLTFELKTSCEEDLPQYMEYDRAEVWMNGALKMKQDGVHDWMPFEFDLDGASTTVEWRYVKDALDETKYPGEDCIWVRNIVWLPELTCTTEAPVELSWIREKFGDLGNYYYDYEEKAKETAANGHKVWECYVAGEDPTDKDSRFTATIKMGADGKPIVSWKPPLNGEDADGAGIREGVRLYSVYGKQTLGDAAEEWTPVAEGDEGNYRFFKVGVGMSEK